MKIHEALALVMTDVRAVSKTEKHGQGWSFRGIDAVVNAVGPACRHHGVVLMPRVLEHHAEVIPSSGGKAMRSVTVRVRYDFIGPEGDVLTAESVGEAMDNGDKATAKAMSVALRTCLLQAFLLPTDDLDPDHDTYEVAAVPKADIKQAKAVAKKAVPAKAVDPAFDADDPQSWPKLLTSAQAKQGVLAWVSGDKDRASAIWQDHFAGWDAYPANGVFDVLTQEYP